MILAVLELELGIPSADSLKAKRTVLRSLKDRVRRQFNVSIAEVEENDQWSVAGLAVVTVANDRRFANRLLSQVVNQVETERDLVLEDYRISFV